MRRQFLQRREFITLLGGATVAWPTLVRAQQSTMPAVAFVSVSSPERSADLVTDFQQGLREAGYIEGQNVAIEYYWRQDRESAPMLMADLVRRRVAVIVARSDTLALPAKAATTTIPIVFTGAADPVANGLFLAASTSPEAI